MGANMNIGDDLRKKLDEARVRDAMKKAVTKTMRDLQDASVLKAPKKTGNLRRSHSNEVILSNDMVEGLLKNSANYWQYVHFGTSRQKPQPFVTEAIQMVKPNTKVIQYFKENYKT